jgi:hypothetical protein
MTLRAGGRAVYSLLVGSAAQADVGYAVARPLALVASPLAFFQGASREDVNALPLPWLGGAALLLAAIGLMFVYFERDRPYAGLRKKLQQIAAGERERLLVTEWRGAYRKLADAVNQALDKTVERSAELAPAAKKKANLDEILGPTPESHVEPYFGFADQAQPKAARGEPAPAPRPAPATAAAVAKLPPPAPSPANGVPVAAVAVGAGPAPLGAAGTKPGLKPPVPVPAPPGVKPAVPVPPKAAPAAPLPSSNDNSGETVDEAAHFREVYTQYLNVRKDCGESVDGLSFEKFEVTLTKTRDQVLAKHPAKGVRFTVYVKEGKAALKAAPLKR